MQRLLRNLGVLVWLAVLGFLVGRAHLTGDERWGFSMFGDIRSYRLSWQWEAEDGDRYDFPVRGYLKGEARLLALSRRSGGEWAIGPGALQSEVERFAEWLYVHQAPRLPGRVVCEIETSEWRVGPWKFHEVVWPPRDQPLSSDRPDRR